VQCFTSPPTQYRLCGRRFLAELAGPNNYKNSVSESGVGSKDVSHLTKTASKHTTLFLEIDWIYSRLIYHQSVAIKPTTFSLLEPCSLAHDVNDIKIG